MSKGDLLPGECMRCDDQRTGAAIWQLTSHRSINHNLYFLTPSMLPDGRHVVYCSYRDGRPNFHCADYRGGEILQLTDADGINGYSGALDKCGSTLYFCRGGEVRALRISDLSEQVLASYDGVLGECSLNADQELIVAAIKTPRGFSLTVTTVDGSGGKVIFSSPRTLIHPQFHPTDPGLIEYAQDPAPRMWTIRADGSDNQCLWQHDNSEFLVHETFLGNGDDLALVRWPHGLQRFNLRTRRMASIARFNAWHIAPTRDGRFIACDTAHPDIGIQIVQVDTGTRHTLCYPGSSNSGTQWQKDFYAGPEDWAKSSPAPADEGQPSSSWLDMKTDTVYGPQWTHPHPSWSPDERAVVFTSDRTGTAQVYVAEIPAGSLAGMNP